VTTWLYEQVHRVPEITDEEIAAMRKIQPVLRVRDSMMFRRIAGAELLHPRDVSCLWNADPIGDEFTCDCLDSTTVITQHHSSVFFKPSLAEVYAWIRFYLRDSWGMVRYFCLENPERIGGSSDFSCRCILIGPRLLERGDEFTLPNGSTGHKLVPIPA